MTTPRFSRWPLPPDTGVPLVVAHRGARRLAPENTLAAARRARALGADAWELDVQFTADGQLVVMHDDTLTRTTDAARLPELAGLAPWRVGDVTLAQIHGLHAGADWTPPRAEPVPTLEEALRLTRDLDWLVNVEIKDHAGLRGDDAIAAAVLEPIRRLDMLPRVLFSSFRHDYLRQLRALEPRALLGALVETRPPQEPAALCALLDAAFYHPLHTLLTDADMAGLRRAGRGALPWTVNEEADMDALLHAGVSGLITDNPQAAMQRTSHAGIVAGQLAKRPRGDARD